ncbi:hypothetical protein Emed_002051 [Eimeria media]
MLGAEGRQGAPRFKVGGPPRQNQQTAAWTENVLHAVSNQKGEKLSELLRDLEILIPEQEIRNMPENVMSAIVHNRMRDMGLLKSFEFSFKRLILELLRFRQMMFRSRGGDVVKQSVLLLDLYLDIYVEVPAASCGWLVPGLAVICSLMNKAALAADAATEEQAELFDDEGGMAETEEQQHKYTKEALNAIRPKLGKVRGDEGRHGAYLVLLGQSIKRCLQLGNMQMAAGFLKLCDSRNILECLVATRLRMGKLPSAELLEKYQIYTTDYVLEENESVLIKHGTILCVERLRFIVFRTLMKRMKDWWAKSGLATKPNIVPISVFTAAIKWQSDDLFDDDEMACISANLIRMGYIKSSSGNSSSSSSSSSSSRSSSSSSSSSSETQRALSLCMDLNVVLCPTAAEITQTPAAAAAVAAAAAAAAVCQKLAFTLPFEGMHGCEAFVPEVEVVCK